MSCGAHKDLSKRTASDKVLRDKSFAIICNPKYSGHQLGIASIVLKFFDKKSKETSTDTETEIVFEAKYLANELDTLITRKLKKHKIYSSYQHNIWGVDLAEMPLISNAIRESGYCYVFSIFIANIHELFL